MGGDRGAMALREQERFHEVAHRHGRVVDEDVHPASGFFLRSNGATSKKIYRRFPPGNEEKGDVEMPEMRRQEFIIEVTRKPEAEVPNHGSCLRGSAIPNLHPVDVTEWDAKFHFATRSRAY